MDPVQVGSITAEPGQRVVGYLDVLERPVSNMRIPVAVIHSGRPGPRLVITAGLHGGEYPCVEAASRIMQQTRPEDIHGVLVVFPLINVMGFEAIEPNVVPIDRQNLNRIFPGDPQGTPSFVLAHWLLETVGRLADCVIDMHGGDLTEKLNPFVIMYETGNPDIDRRSLEMAHIYDTAHIWATSPQHGYPGTFVAELSKRGVPAIVGEAGCYGTYNEDDVRVHLKGAANIMKWSGLTPGDPERTYLGRQQVFREQFAVTTRRAGVFYPLVEPGAEVQQGQVVGSIRNIEGQTLEELVSPRHGIIRILFPKRVVHGGSIVYRAWVA